MPDHALFEVPVAPTKGSIVCHEGAPKVYVLSFSSPPDNRLTPAFNAAFLVALDIIETKLPKGVVVSTSSIAKFYSNGLDLESALKTQHFMRDSLYPLWKRLITYPMPTIAMINGHAFAGGLITAMMHDYRFMNPHKGYLCMNELDFGMPLRPPMSSVFRQKLPQPATYRLMVLESKRFNALEALKDGLVDGLGGWDEILKFIAEMKLVEKAQSTVYGALKKEMWRETISYLEDRDEEKKLEQNELVSTQEAEQVEKRVLEFEKSLKGGRSKL